MTQLLKKFGLLLILAFTTFFSSCEKDLYEEAVYEQPKLNGKFSTVSIEDAPFLKPSIESYKSKHFNNSNGVTYRLIDSLDLELNSIAVYEQENGVKSYSIAIKESVFENDDYYFENLHILESGDKYEYFIIKYNPLDDSKKFDYATYTGKMEVYNEDRIFVGTITFENGAFKLVDTTPPTGDEPIGGGGGIDPGDPNCPCNNSPSLLSQFFSWIGDLFSNININITPGSTDNTGYVLIATSPNIGSSNNNTTPTQTTSGNNIAVTPNEPEWTYPIALQNVMANKIMSRLLYHNPETLPWLGNPANYGLVDQIYFYMAEGGNNPETNNFASGVIEFAVTYLSDNDNENIISETIKVAIYAKNNNYENQPLNSNFYSAIDTDSSVDFIDPIQALNFTRMFVAHCAVIRNENPNWSYWRVFKKGWSDTTHLIGDFGGLVPVIGEFADLANGTLYAIEGDGANATLSYASAIPIGGWFAAGIKFAKRADGLKFVVVGSNNLISFGAYNSKKFRSVLGLIPGDPRQAHHIIPRDFSNNSIVQKAATSNINEGFHMHSAFNGIPIPTTNHLTGHNLYSQKINQILTSLHSSNPNMSPNTAHNHILAITNQIKSHIANHTNYNLGQIANLIQYP